MNYDHRSVHTASGKSLHQYILAGEVAFLKDVAKILQRMYRDAGVVTMSSSAWLEFHDEDDSEHPWGAHLSLITYSGNVIVSLEVEHTAKRSPSKSKSFKVGSLTVDDLVDQIQEWVLEVT